METRQRRVILRAVTGAAVGIVAVAGAFAGLRAHLLDERRSTTQQLAERESTAIVERAEVAVATVGQLAADVPLGDTSRGFVLHAARLSREQHVAVALVDLAGPRAEVVVVTPHDRWPLVPGADLRAQPDLADALDRMADRGAAALSAPLQHDGGEPVLVAAGPVYADSIRPPTVEGQRAALRGAVVSVLVPASLVAEEDEAASSSTRSRVTDGGSLVLDTDAGPVAGGALTTREMDVAGRRWLVTTHPGRPLGEPGVAWAILAIGLAAVLGGAETYRRSAGARARAEDERDQRTRQIELMADASARLQQSLDPGELLPAFAVSLLDDFGLEHVSVELADEHGQVTPAFSLGARGPGNDLVVVPLQRGWRSIGNLVVRPRHELGPVERSSLSAMADALTAALTNARLFQREREAVRRLEELDQLKNAFLGAVSHELRTNVTNITGFASMLVDDWDTLSEQQRRDFAVRLVRNSDSLRLMVNDLLDFARVERGTFTVTPRDVDLSRLVERIVGQMEPMLTGHPVELDVAPGVRSRVDPVAVERILSNLLSNAAKFSPDGAPVHVSVDQDEGWVRLAVRDRGPGIPAEERGRVFVGFYRGDTSAAKSTRGAGIGLAVVKEFAERSGATVEVHDAEGGGAVLTVAFPAAQEVTT